MHKIISTNAIGGNYYADYEEGTWGRARWINGVLHLLGPTASDILYTTPKTLWGDVPHARPESAASPSGGAGAPAASPSGGAGAAGGGASAAATPSIESYTLRMIAGKAKQGSIYKYETATGNVLGRANWVDRGPYDGPRIELLVNERPIVLDTSDELFTVPTYALTVDNLNRYTTPIRSTDAEEGRIYKYNTAKGDVLGRAEWRDHGPHDGRLLHLVIGPDIDDIVFHRHGDLFAAHNPNNMGPAAHNPNNMGSSVGNEVETNNRVTPLTGARCNGCVVSGGSRRSKKSRTRKQRKQKKRRSTRK